MATADKLTYLSQTKSDIRDAIIAKGVSVPAATTFRDYVTKVGEITPTETLNYAERVSQDGGKLVNLQGVVDKLDTGASLQLIPSGGKAGKLHSVLPEDGTGDFTVDRNSTATYVDSDGVVQMALINEPRFDFSDGSAALLVEPQATNLVTYSEDFSNAYWQKVSYTLESGYTAPNGSNSATKLTLLGSFASGNSFIRNAVSHTNPSVFTVYVKNIDAVVFYIRGFYSYNFATKQSSNTNLTSKEVGDGWIKLTMIDPITAFTQFGIGVNENDYSEAGHSVYLWGAQLEEGSVATSYIPTAGSTVTRLKDTITVNPPTGTTSITETIDNIEQAPITTIPPTYTVPNGNINKITMI